MKKKIFHSLAALLLAGLTFTACSDFLEAENKSTGGQTADDIFGSDASTFLTAAYNSLKSIVYNPSLYQQGTDLYINTRGHDPGVYNQYSLTAEDGTVKNFYANLFKTINYANGVVAYAGEGSTLSQEARFLRNYAYYVMTQQFGSVPYVTSYINDANRSYPRTSLEEIYSSMVEDLTDLYNNSSLPAQSHNGRASKQAVAALLAKVYLSAGWDLDAPYSNIEQGTYTVNSTSRFASAAEWAEKAINGINLTMSYADKWSPYNEGNEEEIFSVQYERNGYPGDATSGGHSMQNNYGGYYGACTTSGMKNVGSDNAQSEKSMYLYDPEDLRYDATYMRIMYNGTITGSTADWGTQGYYAYYNMPKADLAKQGIGHQFFPYWVTEAEAEAEFAANKELYKQKNYLTTATAAILTLPNVVTYAFDADGNWTKEVKSVATYNIQVSNGACVKKFDDPSSAQVTDNNDYRDIVLMHVSDMYLIAAEAYLMAGQTAQALSKLNAVRNRAGLPSLNSFGAYEHNYFTTEGFQVRDIDVILDERARELYAEGHRWMDLRRTKQLVRYNVQFNPYVTNAKSMMDVTGSAYKLLRPIPSNEIEMNTAINKEDQNPGY